MDQANGTHAVHRAFACGAHAWLTEIGEGIREATGVWKR
jgi:hypothetical protein